jgi:hypothetical protein
MTYKMASHLPSLILDAMLSLPAVLISIRNRLSLQPRSPSRLGGATNPKPPITTTSSEREMAEDDEDCENESNASDAAENSWIRLHQTQGGANPNPWVP